MRQAPPFPPLAWPQAVEGHETSAQDMSTHSTSAVTRLRQGSSRAGGRLELQVSPQKCLCI